MSVRNTKRFILVEVLVLLVWLVIMFSARKPASMGFYGWCGLVGEICAFIASGISMGAWFHKLQDSRDVTEINGLVYILSIVYLSITLIANTVFWFLGTRNDPKAVPLGVNLVLFLIMVIARIPLASYRDRVLQTSASVSARIRPLTGVSSDLSQLIAMADDETVKSALRKLKENIDFSSSMTHTFSNEAVRELSVKIGEIKALLAGNEAADGIVKNIKDADRILKKNNALSSSIR